MKSGNFVAKYNWKVNKAKVFKDRKKAMKRGYVKHKNPSYDGFSVSERIESLLYRGNLDFYLFQTVFNDFLV